MALGVVSAEKFENWSLGGKIGDMIDRTFKFNTIAEILQALEKETKSDIEEVSPLLAFSFIQTGVRFCQETALNSQIRFAHFSPCQFSTTEKGSFYAYC